MFKKWIFLWVPVILIAVASSACAGNGQEIKTSAGPYVEKASRCLLEGRYEEAITEAKKAIKVEPEDYRGYNILVAAYIYQGKFSEAIREDKKVIKLLESDGGVDWNGVMRHVGLLEATNRQDEAIKFLEEYGRFPEILESVKEAKAKGLYSPYAMLYKLIQLMDRPVDEVIKFLEEHLEVFPEGEKLTELLKRGQSLHDILWK